MLSLACWLGTMLCFVAWISQLSKRTGMALTPVCLCLPREDARGSGGGKGSPQLLWTTLWLGKWVLQVSQRVIAPLLSI